MSARRHVRRQSGLSLIELVVAIAIVAAMYGAVVLSAGTVGGGRAVEREGARLQALVRLACERATLSGRDFGVHFARDGYAFSVATPNGWLFEPKTSDLRPRTFADGIALAVRREGAPLELEETMSEAPQAACFPSGELTPFTAEVSAGPAIAAFEIDGAFDGTVEGRSVEVGQ